MEYKINTSVLNIFTTTTNDIPNNYHVKYLSIGWSEHLRCGIVNNFDTRGIYLDKFI